MTAAKTSGAARGVPGHGAGATILRVDLARGECRTERLDEATWRRYPGGKALAGYLLLSELGPGTDPLSPDNVLVVANGLLTGAPVSTASRYTVAARSPLTGAYGESEAGGYFGPELRMAGIDAIVVTGRSTSPVWLAIRDGEAELRDAGSLWGREPEEVQRAIREELGDKLVRVLQTGIAGENGVRYAALVNELTHFNGRTGMGAVMGAKRLKAIAVRGTTRYAQGAEDPAYLAELGRTLSRRVKEHPLSADLQSKGTTGLVDVLNAAGMLPTRNFGEGVFEGADRINWPCYERDLFGGRGTCYSCSIQCKRQVRGGGRRALDAAYGGPEYETLDGFGGNCGIADLEGVAKANELCNRYVLDTISTSATIAFAMECYERGLIGLEDTGGVALRFGDVDATLRVIGLIARREGIGRLLAEGSRRAAEAIGGDAPKYAIHVKGEELPMHDPRGKVGVGLGYAIGETGADHLYATHDTMLVNPDSLAFRAAQPLGVESLPARELGDRKARNYAILENWTSFGKVAGFCFFGPAPRSFVAVDEVVRLVRASTGWDVTLDDLLAIGERATNLARAFNVREGFSRRDDTLPVRLFEPIPAGPLAGAAISRPEFERTMSALYEIKGWDPGTAAPRRERLRRLDIEWVADLLEA